MLKKSILLSSILAIFLVLPGCSDDDETDPGLPPEASFEVTPSDAFVWEDVYFENKSEGYPLSQLWIIEGAERDTSEKVNVQTRYASPGSYDVTLIVTNAYGTDTLTKEEHVTVSLHEHDFGTLTDDRDGQTYITKQIGEQLWMAENLNFEMEGAVPYNDLEGYRYDYGLLYSYESAAEACPPGWKLPEYDDLMQLKEFLNSERPGGKMKEYGTDHWSAPNQYGCNASGFSARPAGMFYSEGLGFVNMHESATFWTNTEAENGNTWRYSLGFHSGSLDLDNSSISEEHKISVRCIQE